MILKPELIDDGLVALYLCGPLTQSASIHDLVSAVDKLTDAGRGGVILDLTCCKKVTMAGLAALVELAARRPDSQVSYCSLPEPVLRKLRSSGLDRGLRLFDSLKAAIKDPMNRKHRLSRTSAVLLCAGAGRRAAPLTQDCPPHLLDILGRPMVDHALRHFESFGVRRVYLNPAYLGDQSIMYFGKHSDRFPFVQLVNEGVWRGDVWQANPLGPLNTLLRLGDGLSAWNSDLIVQFGNVLTDIDLADFMAYHREQGALATFASLPETTQPPVGANRLRPEPLMTNETAGVFVLSPAVLDVVREAPFSDMERGLLPILARAGATVAQYSGAFSASRVTTAKTYVSAHFESLRNGFSHVRAMGELRGHEIYCAPEADVSPQAILEGPCYIGSGARIARDTILRDGVIVGAGASIDEGAVLKHSVILPDADVEGRSWAQHSLIHKDWHIDHRFVNGAADIATLTLNEDVYRKLWHEPIRTSA